MLKHKTFQITHLINILGYASLEKIEELRKDAERFVQIDLQPESLVGITETRDLYASTVTVWYWDER